VTAARLETGPIAAIRRLRALSYLQESNRQIVQMRHSLVKMADVSDEQYLSEFEAVRGVLLTIYAALPFGALPYDDSESEQLNQVTDTSSWTDELDQVWRSNVAEACEVGALMEATLLLEMTLDRAWLAPAARDLLSALPQPHFALRCGTLSSLALRLFCLDQALLYDKVIFLFHSRLKFYSI
jgi:hypothetical protein